MKRRQFIKVTGAAVSVPLLLHGMRLSAMPKSPVFNAINDDSDRVLVLIQLNGGNDGLNMIVPVDQYSNLFKARANILIPETNLLKITDSVGLHPSMTGIQSLYGDGKVGIVQSVGYPNQNRSHFRSTDIWTSGSPANQFWNTGWLGRYFESDHPGFPEDYPNEGYPDPFALTMGSIVSETCQGTASNFSMTLTDPFSLAPLTEGEGSEVPDTPYGEELQFVRTTIIQTNRYGQRISDAAESGANMAVYPDGNRLAQQLKNVALLIAGGLRTKIYIVSLGGFDTHANQVEGGDPSGGGHAALLQTLSDAIRVFQEDLRLLGLEERVVGMTFSEFGRQIRSNDSLGTDHGTAAPLILFGACVNPTINGINPEIPDEVQVQEGVPMQFDFRDVYGSILIDWFEVGEEEVRTLLYPDFRHLPLLRTCTATSTGAEPDFEAGLHTYAFPNPFRDRTTIQFQSARGEWVRLSLFDALGNEIQILMDKTIPAGEHRIPVDGQQLPAGNYYYRLLMKGRQVTKGIVKI